MMIVRRTYGNITVGIVISSSISISVMITTISIRIISSTITISNFATCASLLRGQPRCWKHPSRLGPHTSSNASSGLSLSFDNKPLPLQHTLITEE